MGAAARWCPLRLRATCLPPAFPTCLLVVLPALLPPLYDFHSRSSFVRFRRRQRCATMSFFQHYRFSQVGLALQEIIDEMIEAETMDEDTQNMLLLQFDKVRGRRERRGGPRAG